MANDEPIAAGGGTGDGTGDGGTNSSGSGGGRRVRAEFRRPQRDRAAGEGSGTGGGSQGGEGASGGGGQFGGGPTPNGGGHPQGVPVDQSTIGARGANGAGGSGVAAGASGASGFDNRTGTGTGSDSPTTEPATFADSSEPAKSAARARRNTLPASGPVRLDEVEVGPVPSGLPDPVPVGKGARGGAGGGARPKGGAGRQEAPMGAPIAGGGGLPDIDGAFFYALKSGRDALALSRGPHWQAATDEALLPVAENFAEALRRAFPDLASQLTKSSPLLAAFTGLALAVAPVLTYERMMMENERARQSATAPESPNPYGTP